MARYRTVCGWCPTELAEDDQSEWVHHFLVAHNDGGGSYSVRHYPLLNEQEEMAALVEGRLPGRFDTSGGQG